MVKYIQIYMILSDGSVFGQLCVPISETHLICLTNERIHLIHLYSVNKKI